jgi:DNA-binding CsgD family transcriptional regulator
MPLTGLQVEIIKAATDGLVNREVADRLGLTPRYVAWLIEDACRILGARNRPHLIAQAIQGGLIPPRLWQDLDKLTDRQQQVAEAVADGLTVDQIAARMHIAPRTVGTHIAQARRASGSATSSVLAGLVASRRYTLDLVSRHAAALRSSPAVPST